MSRLVMIRHAPTTWNEAGRIQGRTDTPLSPAGRVMAAGWRLPPDWTDWRVLTSPLARTRDTAGLLGLTNATSDPRLIEMDWNNWAGRTLAELRSKGGRAMADNEARGLDFRPAGGESPRDVCARLGELLCELADDGRDTIAITHRGVMRAALVLATGWDMQDSAPVRLARDTALVLNLSPDAPASLGDPCTCDLTRQP